MRITDIAMASPDVPGRPSRRKIAGIGRELLVYPSTRYYTGHCTGQRAFRVLKDVMAERLEPLAAGVVLEL